MQGREGFCGHVLAVHRLLQLLHGICQCGDRMAPVPGLAGALNSFEQQMCLIATLIFWCSARSPPTSAPCSSADSKGL